MNKFEDSAHEFVYYYNKMNKKNPKTIDDIDEYIMSLEDSEYKLFLLLIRCF